MHVSILVLTSRVIVFATDSDVILYLYKSLFFSYMPICTLYIIYIMLRCDVPFRRIVDDSTWPEYPTHRSSILSMFRLMLCVPYIGMQTDALILLIAISINSLSAIHNFSPQNLTSKEWPMNFIPYYFPRKI